jgi:N-acetylneuraminate synthase
LWKGRTLYDLYGEAFTPFEWHKKLFEFAKKIDITLFSSPFDESAVDLLESLDAPAFKIASFELVDLPLISYVAKKNKPIFMSTGMASISEIGEAIEVAKSSGCKSLALFHCISSYPTPIDQINLNAIPFLRKEFGLEVGLSDHTLGNLASIVATTLGATVIEKHFILSRDNGGVDSTFSIEPHEMKELVAETKNTFASLGNNGTIRSDLEQGNKVFRRSLYFVKDIKEGQIITAKDVRRIRPGFGLDSKYYYEVIGKKTTRNLTKGERVTLDSFC